MIKMTLSGFIDPNSKEGKARDQNIMNKWKW